MKIALLTLGTRGDVQPYAVLGRGLKTRGHHVTLSTGKNFGSMANEYGLDFAPVQADFNALINSEEGKEMMKNPFLARKHFKNIVQPMMINALRTFYLLSRESDCVLFHVKSLADYFADQFPERMIRANVVPAIEPTDDFPNPVFSGLSLPAMFNRLTYKLSDLGLAMMNKAIKQFRQDANLDLKIPKRLELTSIYGISPYFLPMPKDYPDNSHYTGFWHDTSPQELDPDVLEFVQSELPTVLVTFGSMTFETKLDLINGLILLSERLNTKVLIVKGWGFENVAAYNGQKRIKIIQSAPYDKLFPKVKAVVHHGGIGTIAECLRAGVPFLSCPVIYPMGDQHFWGKRAYVIGCSVSPIPLRKLTIEKLIENVRELLTSRSISQRGIEIANALKHENGVVSAISVVENFFR